MSHWLDLLLSHVQSSTNTFLRICFHLQILWEKPYRIFWLGLETIFSLVGIIPHICNLFYTTAIWGVEILHLKVHKFATKVVLRQISINYHPRTQIMKILMCTLNCESNYTLRKMARWVKHYTMCKIAEFITFFLSLKALSFKSPVENFILDSKLLHNQQLRWLWQMWGVVRHHQDLV